MLHVDSMIGKNILQSFARLRRNLPFSQIAMAGARSTSSAPSDGEPHDPKSEGKTAKFNARSYLESRYVGQANEYRKQFVLKQFHDFYQGFHSEWNPEKARLLEFGGGPCIHTLISAAPCVSEIAFADYAENNLKEVRKWRNGDPCSFDWTSYFCYVVGELEGRSDQPTATTDREKLLRSRIASVIPCDIRKENPLGDLTNHGSHELFDIVSCSLTLVVTSVTHNEYKANLQKLLSLLKPKGFFIGIEALEMSWSCAGDTRYTTTEVTANGLHDIMRASGLEVLTSHCLNIPEEKRNKASNAKAYMFNAARRMY